LETMDVLIDTCTVNRLLDIDEPADGDRNYEEDRSCLSRITKEYVECGSVRLLVNPTVKSEIDKTPDAARRRELQEQFAQHLFTPFSAAVFPITFPVTFLTDEQKKALEDLFARLPVKYRKDRKIFADAMCNKEIAVLLTTDREHLANDTFRGLLRDKGLDSRVMVLTPRELLEHLQKER